MEKVRIIMQSSENGEDKYVTFSDDFDTLLADFERPDCIDISESITEIDLPSGFPMNYDLKRK